MRKTTLEVLSSIFIKYPTWIKIGKFEINQINRRTLLGVWWITLHQIIWLFSMSFIYSRLFGIPENDYLVYICASLIAWTWISSMISDGGNVFIENRAIIVATKIDKKILINSVAFKYFLIFLYQVPVFIVLCIFGKVNLNLNSLWIIPNICIVMLISINIIGITSYYYARFRDIQKLITASMTILLMITPVFWKAEQLTGNANFIVIFNPLYYLITLLRNPFTGKEVPLIVYIVSILFYLITLVMYCYTIKTKFRKIIHLV